MSISDLAYKAMIRREKIRDIVESCRSYRKEMEIFYDDPMTIASGMGDELSPLIGKGHKTRCLRCMKKIRALDK